MIQRFVAFDKSDEPVSVGGLAGFTKGDGLQLPGFACVSSGSNALFSVLQRLCPLSLLC
jgi:hypothetical protein